MSAPASLTELWVYLAASPLTALTMTLIAYQCGMWISAKAGFSPLANPVLLAVLLLVGLLLFTGTDYRTYFEGAQFVHFLLGPATVALALPLYRQIERVRRSALAITVSLITGGAVAAATAVAIGAFFGAGPDILASLAPKSVTAAVAMGIADKLGGLPSLTAVLVMITGVIGAALGPLLLTLLGVRDPASRGLAIGTAAHGIGTARALQMSDLEGAFAGLAMGLNALATALLLPLVWGWVF